MHQPVLCTTQLSSFILLGKMGCSALLSNHLSLSRDKCLFFLNVLLVAHSSFRVLSLIRFLQVRLLQVRLLQVSTFF